MNDYVSKPFEEEELIHKISILLNKNKITGRSVIIAEPMPQGLYSLDKLIEMSKGNSAFITKMVKIFIELTPDAISKIKTHYQNNEFDKVKAVAHSIKPGIDFLSIVEITDVIRRIETFSEKNTSIEELGDLILTLEQTIDIVIADLKEKS